MKKGLLLLMIILGTLFHATAQDKTITGSVKDNEGAILENATVVVKGTNISGRTDENGQYKIGPVKVGSTLVFSYVGYAQKEIRISAASVINVLLEKESGKMEDVVIVGYGTQRKKDLTVSIEKVNMDDLNKAPVRSFTEAFAGRVAGVQVTSADGQPGADSRIVIRGNNSITQDNSPLYIIDGFPLEGVNSNILNPEDIESIEVLKDASATAIYGSRGANGVIMITTKKGKEGPPVINFSTSYGIQQSNNTMEMMSPYDFVKLQLEKDTTSTATSPRTLYLTSPAKSLEDYRNTPALDWQSKVLRTAPMKINSLSINGGSQNTKYLISGSVTNQDGIIINSNYTRYQGRVSLDQVVNTKFKVGLNANYSMLKQTGTSIAQSNNSATTNVMYGVWGYRPLQSPDGDLSDLLFDPEINTSNDYRINPIINLQNAINNRNTRSLIANVYGEYAILSDLKLRVTGGINENILRNDVFNNTKTQYGNPITTTNGVNGSKIFTEGSTWVNENILTWNKRIKSNPLSLVGVASIQGGKNSAYGASANQVPNESLGLSGLDEGVPQVVTSNSTEWKLASFAARANYSLKYKYYFTASYRADGSSRFATGKRWGYFPAASFAWRFKNEKFLKGQNLLSDGKLRIGYGSNGNNRVGDFAYLSTIGLPIGNSYTIGNSVNRGSVPTAFGNADLKWETTTEINLGLDLAFLRNKVTFTAEAYRKKTKDLLLFATLPLSSGYSNAFKNIGSVQNEGLEFTLNTTNVKNKNFSWTTSFNIGFNKNKVLSLNDNQESLTSSITWDNGWQSIPAYLAKINNPIGLMFGYVWDGVYQTSDFYKNTAGAYVLRDEVATNGNVRSNIQPGDIKYKDLNGDRIINSSDYSIIGNGVPKHAGGLSNNFTYKGFDLNVFFQWSYGNDVLNTNRLVFDGNALGRANLNQFTSYNQRWSPENSSSNIFRTNGYFGGGYSSYLVEDGSFIRLKTIALGYNIPSDFVNKGKIKSLRIFASAQNLITWTNYSGMDPEVNTYNSALTPGFDWSAYPRARTITFGANLSF